MQSASAKRSKHNGGYMLEVLRYIKDFDERLAKSGCLEHVGYMTQKFATAKKAIEFYDQHNPHMRSINAHRTWCSDWDPDTMLQYIIREFHGEVGTISGFGEGRGETLRRIREQEAEI